MTEKTTKERVREKIDSFQGRSFTLKELHSSFRPRIKMALIRYHVNDMVNNLELYKSPRAGFHAQTYQQKDMLLELEDNINTEGAAYSFIQDLDDIVRVSLAGARVAPSMLTDLRNTMSNLIDELEEEVKELKYLHDCNDLWRIHSLVNRRAFRGKE